MYGHHFVIPGTDSPCRAPVKASVPLSGPAHRLSSTDSHGLFLRAPICQARHRFSFGAPFSVAPTISRALLCSGTISYTSHQFPLSCTSLGIGTVIWTSAPFIGHRLCVSSTDYFPGHRFVNSGIDSLSEHRFLWHRLYRGAPIPLSEHRFVWAPLRYTRHRLPLSRSGLGTGTVIWTSVSSTDYFSGHRYLSGGTDLPWGAPFSLARLF